MVTAVQREQPPTVDDAFRVLAAHQVNMITGFCVLCGVKAPCWLRHVALQLLQNERGMNENH